MSLTDDINYRQVLSTSMAYRLPGIQDLVFNSNPVTAELRKRGRFKKFDGPEIRVSLMIDKFDGQWIAGYDKFDIQAKEIVNDAVFTPKTLVVPFSLTGQEIRANRGNRTRVHNLLSTYMENVENSAKDLWEISLHSDGTTAAGREMIGFGGALPIIPTSGVYGGIDRGTHAIWRTSTFDANTDFTAQGITGWDSTTARAIIERVTALRSKGNRYPGLWIMDLNSYQALSAGMVAIQRIVKSDGGSATYGYNALEVATPAGNVDVVCATGVGTVMPANTAYALDLQALSVFERPGASWDLLFSGEGMQPINQDAIAQGIMWEGELVLENPRYSARVLTDPPA